jgi:ATP-dependent DNA helicase DinG
MRCGYHHRGALGTIVIEVEVHQQLRAFLRTQGGDEWPHHLTIARLAARALRLHRKTAIHISRAAAYQGHYRLGYLAAIMLWQEPVLLIVPAATQQAICHRDLPQLREWLSSKKPVWTTDTWPDPSFSGILLWSLESWLAKSLSGHPLPPAHWSIVLDGAELLECQTRQHLTLSLSSQDWDELLWGCPSLNEMIRDSRVQLTRQVFHHPPNPYHCVRVEQPEQSLLRTLVECLHQSAHGLHLPKWQQLYFYLRDGNVLFWAEVNRQQGTFTLKGSPLKLQEPAQREWLSRTNILFASGTEPDSFPMAFLHNLGIEEFTSVMLPPERHAEAIQLFLPDGIPLPNTPEFEPALLKHLYQLLRLHIQTHGFQVLIVDDLPLKHRVASILAAEFGSRVKVETECARDAILITGWEFWQRSQRYLPKPHCLAIATLPFPSLEHPVVSGRVEYYKQQRQDWFRLYLLPEALEQLQTAIAPIRDGRGMVALFDNRVLHRSYGKQILAVLSPYARLTYLDETSLTPAPW